MLHRIVGSGDYGACWIGILTETGRRWVFGSMQARVVAGRTVRSMLSVLKISVGSIVAHNDGKGDVSTEEQMTQPRQGSWALC